MLPRHSSTNRFKRLDPVENLHESKVVTKDNLYWKAYEFPTTIQEFGAITYIDTRPTHPYDIAVSSSTRIQIYSHETNERLKTFTRFHNTVYGASYRSDGNLIVAGNEDCKVRLFDNEGRVPLRIFKGHSRPVHVSKFCNNLKHIFTASDDKTMRIWDVATEKSIATFSEHQDYIRTGAVCKSSADVIATGSYDHTVKLYDARTETSVLSVDHGQPVESVLVYPSGSLLLSAGGNTIKVWDVLQGGKLLTAFSHHHKTITCLAFSHDHSRILSGSLDRHVKIYDVATYGVVHNIDYPAPVLSLAVSNEDRTIAVGMLDKMLSLKKRKTRNLDRLTEKEISSKKRRREAYYIPGKDYSPNEDDIVIYHTQKEYLPRYDRYFQKFQHSKALDAVLQTDTKPEVTVAVLKELIRRDRLKPALAGRSSSKLGHLLKFVAKYITKVSFSSTLLEVADTLIDIYYPEIHEHSETIRLLFLRLRETIRNEAELHREMHSLMGSVDAILATHGKAALNRNTDGHSSKVGIA